MHFQNELTKALNIRYPLVMAPMFLVSNEAMVKAAIKSGILGCFPSLNYRTPGTLEKLLVELNRYVLEFPGGNYAVNIIVQQTNRLRDEHLKICEEHRAPVYITSLGNPAPVIEAAKSYGAKVFCDVTNQVHAKKCADAGCDGFIAVGQGAGGHAGPFPTHLQIGRAHV